LAQSVISIINAEDYGRAIFDLFLRRELIGMGADIVNDAYIHDPDVTAVNLIEGAEMKLFNLAESGPTEGGPRRFDSVVKNALEMAGGAFKRDSHFTGGPTKLDDLDTKRGGLQPSDLIILAVRPSMGKTSLATNMGFNATKEAKSGEAGDTFSVAFFSMEMSAEQLAHRIMADVSGISSDRIRRGEVLD